MPPGQQKDTREAANASLGDNGPSDDPESVAVGVNSVILSRDDTSLSQAGLEEKTGPTSATGVEVIPKLNTSHRDGPENHAGRILENLEGAEEAETSLNSMTENMETSSGTSSMLKPPDISPRAPDESRPAEIRTLEASDHTTRPELSASSAPSNDTSNRLPSELGAERSATDGVEEQSAETSPKENAAQAIFQVKDAGEPREGLQHGKLESRDEHGKRPATDANLERPSTKKSRPEMVPEGPRSAGEIPLARTYTTSFMHRKAVSHVISSRTCEFVVTASTDGHLKFWKRRHQGLEFVKTYRAHIGPVQCMALNGDESLLLTIGEHDNTLKLYNIVDFDMINRLELPFTPSAATFYKSEDGIETAVAVSEKKHSAVHLVPITGSSLSTPKDRPFQRHMPSGVHAMVIHPKGFIISTDLSGGIEFWVPNPREDFPSATAVNFPQALSFRMKVETDLYCLQHDKTYAVCMALSRSGRYMALLGADGKLRIIRVKTGKRFKVLDESIEAQVEIQKKLSEDSPLQIPQADLEKRLIAEQELRSASDWLLRQSLTFDETGNNLIYPTLLGLKVFNITNNRLMGIIGKDEQALRFISASIVPRIAELNLLIGISSGSGQISQGQTLPLLVATAFKSQRFYIFTPYDVKPDSTRDVTNESPATEEPMAPHEQVVSKISTSKPSLIRRATRATIHTTYGDIKILLFPDECPKTVENFAVHAQRRYYDGLMFHRVIRGFMIQTGDPRGDGTGGESIWGGEFADEFCRKLKHDRPYTLSMANAGPNTNGSQFFITTVPTPFLDGKHTVFGRVEEGTNIVHEIEETRTNLEDKPLKDIKILTIRITEEAPEA